jgi:hypothetical protein
LLLGETFKEEENDRLQEMLDANFTILLDKRNESKEGSSSGIPEQNLEKQ